MNLDQRAMTEADWLASADAQEIYRPNPNIQPHQMLQFLGVHRKVDRTKAGRRRLRFFACACCRRFWSSLSDESREAVEIAERYADGRATRKELGHAWRTTVRQYGHGPRTADGIAGHVVEAGAMTAAALVPMLSYSVICSTPRPPHELWRELFVQASLVRDIFGNPFRNVVIDPAYFTGRNRCVQDMAREIYSERTFRRLPGIGDALKAAGCNDLDVMQHCRQDFEHARGCWVIDALLCDRRSPRLACG